MPHEGTLLQSLTKPEDGGVTFSSFSDPYKVRLTGHDLNNQIQI